MRNMYIICTCKILKSKNFFKCFQGSLPFHTSLLQASVAPQSIQKVPFKSTVANQGGEPYKDRPQRPQDNNANELEFIRHVFKTSEDSGFLYSHKCFLNVSQLIVQLAKQSDPTLDPVMDRLVCF